MGPATQIWFPPRMPPLPLAKLIIGEERGRHHCAWRGLGWCKVWYQKGAKLQGKQNPPKWMCKSYFCKLLEFTRPGQTLLQNIYTVFQAELNIYFHFDKFSFKVCMYLHGIRIRINSFTLLCFPIFPENISLDFNNLKNLLPNLISIQLDMRIF